jgi:hypothetical protein
MQFWYYFNSKKVEAAVKDKNTNIIVYFNRCEKWTNRWKLKKLGYKTFNLYGGIFEYKNSGRQVVNNQKKWQTVHTFNKTWSLLLTKGIKVYETDALLFIRTLN